MTDNIFADDWREQQETQFQYIARVGTPEQRISMRIIMHDLGYTDEQLDLLYLHATMHQDELPLDFVPDVNLIDRLRNVRHPNECVCPACKPKS